MACCVLFAYLVGRLRRAFTQRTADESTTERAPAATRPAPTRS